MNDIDRPPDRKQLFELASQQAGYFTTRQAKRCGFSRSLLSHHAREGLYYRVYQGVYRLRDYPSTPREEVVAALLAAGEDAVVSHDSALDLYDLSDVVPAAIHITVSRSRRGYRAPPGVKLHTTTLPIQGAEVRTKNGLRVSSV